ncbi:hypothetical protein [Burkholderia glumae]|uniref:hypothetical protein n=1 Tax=Burkholderia glumae TaxID=337 RepID=UPI001872EFCF|nr:hypothetical protein [Burkholderia glumae]
MDITQHNVVNIVNQDVGLSRTQSMLDAIQLEAVRLDCHFVQQGEATFVPFELKTVIAQTLPEANGVAYRDTTLDATLESLSAQGIYLKMGPTTDEYLRAAGWRWKGNGNGAAGVAAVGATDVNALPACDMTPRDPARIVIDVTRDQLVMTADDLIVTSAWRADAYATDVRRFAVKPMSQAPDAPEPRLYMIVVQDADGPADREKVMVDRLTFAGADEVLVRMRLCIRKHLGVEFIDTEKPAGKTHVEESGDTVAPESFGSLMKDLAVRCASVAVVILSVIFVVEGFSVITIAAGRILSWGARLLS